MSTTLLILNSQDDCDKVSACFRSCLTTNKTAYDPIENTYPERAEGTPDLPEVLGFNGIGNATIK